MPTLNFGHVSWMNLQLNGLMGTKLGYDRYELTGAVPSSGVISRANSGGGQIKRKGNNGRVWSDQKMRMWSCVRGQVKAHGCTQCMHCHLVSAWVTWTSCLGCLRANCFRSPVVFIKPGIRPPITTPLAQFYLNLLYFVPRLTLPSEVSTPGERGSPVQFVRTYFDQI